MKRHLSLTAIRLLTVGMTVLAATLNHYLSLQGDWWPTFLALWPAVFVSAYLGGWRHGAASVLIGALLTATFHPSMRDGRNVQEWFSVVGYLAGGGVFIWFCRAQKALGIGANGEPFVQQFAPWKVMAVTVAASLAVVWANFSLHPALGRSIPFAFFYPVMAFVGFVGGARPVLVVTVIGLVSVSMWQSDLAGTGATPAFDVLRGIFLFIGLTYAFFSEAVVRERARAVAGAAALKELPEAQARFSAITQTSPDALWIWDMNSERLAFISPASEKLTGLTVEEARAQTKEERAESIHPDDRPIVEEAFRTLEAAPPGQTVEYEYRHRHRNGNYLWLRNRAGVFSRNPDGRLAQVFGHTEDVTERRHAKERLTRQAAELSRIADEREATLHERETLLAAERVARSEAERANRLKDDFLATVSHELRTPLTAILGWTALLGEDARDDEMRNGLEVISRNARAQRQLIEDLLDMSRVMTGKLRIDRQTALLGDIIGGAVETARPAAEARGVTLTSETGECREPIQADAGRLQQVIWNLLSNAVKFTPAGGSAHIHAACAGDWATISVTDTGQGMAPEFVPHVFERFRQEDSATTRKTGGLGLGLGIVKHLVELHGGEVTAHSDGVGKGSRFTVALPLHHPGLELTPATLASSSPRAKAASADSRHIPFAGRSLLVIDDEPDTRSYLSRVLTERGATVASVDNASEGLRHALGKHPDAVICDISMPGEDGYSFIRALRNAEHGRTRSTRVAALTALARAEDRARALSAGFDEHCSKPIEPTELVALVSRLLLDNAS